MISILHDISVYKKYNTLKLKLYVNHLNFENFNSTALFKLIFLIVLLSNIYLSYAEVDIEVKSG